MWEYNHTNELSHFGVPGMRWGHRRGPGSSVSNHVERNIVNKKRDKKAEKELKRLKKSRPELSSDAKYILDKYKVNTNIDHNLPKETRGKVDVIKKRDEFDKALSVNIGKVHTEAVMELNGSKTLKELNLKFNNADWNKSGVEAAYENSYEKAFTKIYDVKMKDLLTTRP